MPPTNASIHHGTKSVLSLRHNSAFKTDVLETKPGYTGTSSMEKEYTIIELKEAGQ